MGNWKENAFIEKLQRILRICLVVLGIAVFAILVVGTILRLFNVNWGGYGEVITLVVFWFYMLGAAYVGCGDGYTKNEVCDSLLKPGVALHTIKLIRKIVIALIGLIMCWWGIRLCMYSVEQGLSTVAYGVPMMIGYISMIAGMGIGSVFHVLHLIDYGKFYISTYIRKEAEV